MADAGLDPPRSRARPAQTSTWFGTIAEAGLSTSKQRRATTMKHPDVLTQRSCADVHSVWRQQLQDQRDAQLAENLKRREHELLPCFGDYCQRGQEAARTVAAGDRTTLAAITVASTDTATGGSPAGWQYNHG